MSDGIDYDCPAEETDELFYDRSSMGNSPSNDEEHAGADQSQQESFEHDTTMAQRHTQFLDLTSYGDGVDMIRDAGSEYDEEEDDDGDDEDDGGGGGMPHQPQARSSGSVTKHGKSSKYSSSDTPGKVVDSGHEHTGRWTREEHEAFLSALRVYGKEWKKVAAKVKTRTVVQTRTHAQKYFQKLQKAVEQSGGKVVTEMDVEMGVAAEPKKVPSHTKRKRHEGTVIGATVAAPTPAKSILPPLTKPVRSASMIGAAQLISNLSSAKTMQMQAPAPQPAANLFGGGNGSATTVLSLNHHHGSTSAVPLSQPLQPPHGFTTTTSSDSMHNPFSATASTTTTSGWNTSSLMKIVAPDHDSASKQGKFPEPSPAACGKRKLAEIAAARMLAGVAAGGSHIPSSTYAVSQTDGDATPPEPGVVESIPRDIPLLPLEVPAPPRKGLSLQIVNPETLGVVQDERRRRHGEMSPQTPWDSQLEVLVSESRTGSDDQARKRPMGNGLGLAAETPPLAVCGPSTSHGRSIIHMAVCELDLASLEQALSDPANQALLDRRDAAGFCPIHTACALPMAHPDQAPLIFDILRMLLSTGASASATDINENTALHWAARAGCRELAQVLLSKNCPPDNKNKQGETALHWALRAGRNGMDVVSVLLENGARPSVLNNEFKRPIDVAADGFLDKNGDPCHFMDDLMKRRKKLSKEQKKQFQDVLMERCEARKHLLILSTQSRTLVLHHPECLQHIPKSKTDWEVPDRVTSIMRRILPSYDATGATETSGIFAHEVTVTQEFERAKIELLRRIHSTEYLAFVNDLSKELERQHKEALDTEATTFNEDPMNSTKAGAPPVVPFTPMVQRSMIKIEEPKVKLGVHSDTSFCAGSLRAARRAAGAVQHAVDCVLVGRNRNAFCVVRPPGHHAGTNGLLDGGESCGFCIFNNVAAGAMHAISDERLLCERCAIVDIDVHHGNGTEEIVRKCQDPRKLFFFSIHLYDNDKKKRGTGNYKFYPGTGDEDDVAFNIINVPIAPLWREGVSVPGTPLNTHNTRQKTKTKPSSRSSPSQEGDESSEPEPGTPLEKASDVESEAASMRGASSSSNAASPRKTGPMLAGRLAYRDAIQNRLLPALRAFDPDLIIISAGFDASKGDVGNARHERGGKERMGMDLEPEDYAWTTRKILQVADICCQGRVVSVLEGGYGRTPPGERNLDTPLDKTFFAECAVRHLQAMLDPYDAEARFAS